MQLGLGADFEVTEGSKLGVVLQSVVFIVLTAMMTRRSINTGKGVSLNVKYTRLSQVYVIPLHLTPDVTYESILAGTLLPARVFMC
jgi:hypothetical protein